nr:glycolate oxidase subunit GlcE [uncultured Amphritea sp.]
MIDIPTLADQIAQAAADKTPLQLQGGGSKAFYGEVVEGTLLPLGEHRGIINYEPSELVITARAGTPLKEIEQLLEREGQMLGFEPPRFSDNATLGGTIACGLSGPRRPYAGAARDFVLGVTLMNGKGQLLKFGGQVMKNVAGYDLSRLMCGALGTLGVLLEISLKVIPKPQYEETRVIAADFSQMQHLLAEIGRKPFPVSATLLENNRLFIRLSGAQGGVAEASQHIGGDKLSDNDAPWLGVKEQQHDFFNQPKPLWRLSLPPMAPAVPASLFDGPTLIEWGGALRWLYSQQSDSLQQWAKANGGHATCFKNPLPGSPIFTPLPPALLALHQRLKARFDPAGILNPGRLYPDL